MHTYMHIYKSVTFSEVQGMTELNSLTAAVKVKVLGPFMLQLDLDTTNFGKYSGTPKQLLYEYKSTNTDATRPLHHQLRRILGRRRSAAGEPEGSFVRDNTHTHTHTHTHTQAAA
jgi:hypothetical protein